MIGQKYGWVNLQQLYGLLLGDVGVHHAVRHVLLVSKVRLWPQILLPLQELVNRLRLPHIHASEVGAAHLLAVEKLHLLLLVRDDQGRLVLQHLVRQLQALDALQLRVNRLAFHAGVVTENAVEHVLLRQLKPVLVSDLTGNDAASWGGVPEVICAQKLQNLKLLPNEFLLHKQVLL